MIYLGLDGLIFHLDPWSTWALFLCMVWGMDLVLSCSKCPPSCPSTICLKVYCFPSDLRCSFVMCMHICFGAFYSFRLCVHSYFRITLPHIHLAILCVSLPREYSHMNCLLQCSSLLGGRKSMGLSTGLCLCLFIFQRSSSNICELEMILTYISNICKD